MNPRRLRKTYQEAVAREAKPMDDPRFRFALQRHLATGEYPADEELSKLIRSWRVIQVVEVTIRPDVLTKADAAARLPFTPTDEDWSVAVQWGEDIARAAKGKRRHTFN